jgi:outer membrane protein
MTLALACALTAAAVIGDETQTTTLTLKDAFARALKSNLAVGRARESVHVAEAQRKGAISLVLPRLSLNASGIRNTDEVSFGVASERRVILPRNDWNLRLTLQQPIFAGLREKRAYDQARIGLESAREDLVGAQDAALLQVAADYLAAVQGQALIDVEQRNVGLAENRKVQATSLFEAGEATRVDVLRAETAIKAAERRLVAARQERDKALGHLRIDLALDGAVAVQEPDTMLPPLPDETRLLERAETARAEVRSAERALTIARLEVSKQQGANLPVISADAGYISQKTTFPLDRYGYAAVRLTLPIFQGGEVGARVAAAQAQAQQAALTLEETRRRVREEVRTALLDLSAATSNLSLAEEQLKAAEAEHDQSLDLYRNQEATAVDLESAEAALADARRAAVTGRLDRMLAEIRAWYAAGALQAAISKEDLP